MRATSSTSSSARAHRCWSCSPSGTSSAGSTSRRSVASWPNGDWSTPATCSIRRPCVDAASPTTPSGGAEVVARIVVTGGAGFLGSHICETLVSRGDEVVAIDNLLTGGVDNISHLFGEKGFVFVEHDVTNYVHVSGPVDAVMHFASPASPVDYLAHPIKTLKVGRLGTHQTLGVADDK